MRTRVHSASLFTVRARGRQRPGIPREIWLAGLVRPECSGSMIGLASIYKLESEGQGRQLMSILPYAYTYVHMRLHTRTHAHTCPNAEHKCMHAYHVHTHTNMKE